jgi:hypothetical protein
MTARILHFPIAAQEPIRSAMINWTLIVALTLNFATVVGLGFVAWRFFRGEIDQRRDHWTYRIRCRRGPVFPLRLAGHVSALAAELRACAAILWRDADKHSDPDAIRLLASTAHASALKLECGIIDSIDDCTEVYGDYPGDTAIFDLMDAEP